MTHTPAEALATEIGTQVGSLTLGTNLFHSTIRAPDGTIPENSVFAWDGGGAPPLRTMSEPDEVRKSVILVSVRNTKYGTGSDLAILIMNSLRAQSISTYLDLELMNSAPRSLGQDEEGLHHFGLEFILTYQEP